MATLIATRTAQRPLVAEFTFNFDDLMVPISGGTAIAGSSAVDFGKTNIASTVFEVINLPRDSIVLGGEVVTETAFDTAAYNVSVGDSGTADRYLAATDKKGTGRTALVPTGYRNASGLNLRVTIANTDVCTTGKMVVRVQYMIDGRAEEVYPS